MKNQITLLGTLTCEIEWNGSRLTQKQLAVVQSDKEFGLPGKDHLPKHGVNNVTAVYLPAMKGDKSRDVDARITANVLQSQKIPVLLQEKVTEKLEQMVRQGILEPVHPGGITNASPVVWQRKKSGELGFCVDLKVHINGKVMDENYPIQVMRTIFHNLHGASYFGKIDLSDAYYQINLVEEAKDICRIDTSQGVFKVCRLPQELKNSSPIFGLH